MDENKSLVRRMYERVFKDGDINALRDFFAPDVIDHEPLSLQPSGIEGIEYKYAITRLAFPNWDSEVDEIIAEGDKVVILGKFKGNQSGEYLGRKATDRHVEVPEISVFRLADGKIAEICGGPDEYRILKQLENS